MVRNLSIWAKKFEAPMPSVIRRGPLTGDTPRLLSESAQQLGRRAFLRCGQTSRHLAKPVDMSGEHLVHPHPSLGRELAEDDPLVCRRRSPTHQSTVF